MIGQNQLERASTGRRPWVGQKEKSKSASRVSMTLPSETVVDAAFVAESFPTELTLVQTTNARIALAR